VTDNKENGDPFLRVIKTFTNTHIIDPIVEELNEIIEGTLNSLTSRKDRLHENSRSSCVKLYIINFCIDISSVLVEFVFFMHLLIIFIKYEKENEIYNYIRGN